VKGALFPSGTALVARHFPAALSQIPKYNVKLGLICQRLVGRALTPAKCGRLTSEHNRPMPSRKTQSSAEAKLTEAGVASCDRSGRQELFYTGFQSRIAASPEKAPLMR